MFIIFTTLDLQLSTNILVDLESYPESLQISWHYALTYRESVQDKFFLLLIYSHNIYLRREGVGHQTVLCGMVRRVRCVQVQCNSRRTELFYLYYFCYSYAAKQW